MPHESDRKKQFPSPLMDLIEAGTVSETWSPPGVMSLD